MKRVLVFFGIILFAIDTFGQFNAQRNREGTFYTSWGWNRSSYTDSDMRFKGRNYDFTLKDVAATDEPLTFKPRIHLNPVKLTVPQTNFRLGYFLNEHYSIAIGFDHMKYVMVQNQVVNIDGTISESGTEYDGNYENDEIQLSRRFLEYENTDGLNYVHVELNRHDHLLSININRAHTLFDFESIFGISAGALYPRTDAHLMNFKRNNEFHITGYGTAIKGGGRFSFLRYFFVQFEFRGGYINMPRVRATEFADEYVSQSFFYYQRNILFGGTFRLSKDKNKEGSAKNS